MVDELLGLRRAAAPDGRRHRAAAGAGAGPRARRCCSRAGQATLLDVDHGTYPFVTSSSADGRRRLHRLRASRRRASTGSSRSSRPTRPGSARGRSRPSCIDDMGEFLRKTGAEFGTTTGRPRRCGWFDAVDRPLRHADQRRHRLRPHQARRADRAGAGAGVRGLRRRRRAARRDADDARPTSTTRCRSTRTSPAGRRTSPPAARSRTCRPTPGLRRARSRR